MSHRVPLLCAVLALAVSSDALAGWSEREPVGTNINHVYLAPGGPGWVVGFPAATPSRLRYALRPIGGTVGTVTEFPGTSGTVTGREPIPYFDADGDAVIANEDTRHVAYRRADGGDDFDEVLNADAQHRPKLVSVASTGEAMIGMQGSTPTGVIKVAFRPAGSDVAVQEETAESFDTSSVLIGLQLQDDGGAIVVWQKDNALWQSVRPAGASSFNTPTEITTPGDPRKSTVAFDSTPNGWAMLTWYGSTDGGQFRSDRALATVRAPNGSFGPATVIATSPVAGGIVNVAPAITTTGAGIATWRHVSAGDCSPTGVMGAVYQGGTFATMAPLAGSAYPEVSITSLFAVSAGDHIAVPVVEVHDDGDPCGFNDDTRELSVRHFRGTASGLVDEGKSTVVGVERRDDESAKWPLFNDVAIEPGGRMFGWVQVDGLERYLMTYDGVPDVPSSGGSGGGDDDGDDKGGAGAPQPGPPAQPAQPAVTPPPPIRRPLPPIVPRNFVRVAPIDPAVLEVEFSCVATPDELCGVDYAVYYAFTGRLPKPPKASAAQRRRQTTLKVATAKATLRGGQRKKVKLKLTKDGRRVLRLRRKLKLIAETRVTVGGRTATERVTTTLKAPKRKARRRA